MFSSPKQPINQIICGDAQAVLKTLPAGSVDCVVTSPPYWGLRDFGVDGQLGLEPNVEDFVERLCLVFDEVRRVLKEPGTLWVNLGDTYGGDAPVRSRAGEQFTRTKPHLRRSSGKGSSVRKKSLALAPSRFALAMTKRGWLLRNEIIWHKPNIMPQSAADRFTHNFEKIYFFTQSPRYYFKRQYEPLSDPKSAARAKPLNPIGRRKRIYGDPLIAAMNPKTLEASRKRMLRLGRNKRAVWTIATRPFHGDHSATFPPALVETPIKAGCPPGGIVLDPFLGSGTTALVARKLGRKFIGIDLNPEYVRMAEERLSQPNVARRLAA